MATITIGFTTTKERKAAVRRLGWSFGNATKLQGCWIIFKNRHLAASVVNGLVLNGMCFDVTVNESE